MYTSKISSLNVKQKNKKNQNVLKNHLTERSLANQLQNHWFMIVLTRLLDLEFKEPTQ